MDLIYSITILSIMATCKLERRIDLRELSVKLKGFEYNNGASWFGVFRNYHLNGKIEITVKGTIISLGTRKEEDAKADILYTIQRLQGLKGVFI